MRCLAPSLALVLLIALGLEAPRLGAQGQPAGPGIGFRNDLNAPVIVQGISVVNNMQRRGQPFLVKPGTTVWDNNLPKNSTRYYTIYDANLQRLLLRDQNV